MTAGIDMAAVAALAGDPGRANMLAAMLDGRAHTATELGQLAGIAAPTASGHLARLVRGRLVEVTAEGRHRYFRLASAEVAGMLEGIMVVAAAPAPSGAPGVSRATPRIDPALRRARTCYDHIAGELGVAIADTLVARGAVEIGGGGVTVTEAGRTLLASLGISLDSTRRTRRLHCRLCLDWSERRPHLAGLLGAALLDRALESGVVRRCQSSRALATSGGSVGDALHRLLTPDPGRFGVVRRQ